MVWQLVVALSVVLLGGILSWAAYVMKQGRAGAVERATLAANLNAIANQLGSLAGIVTTLSEKEATVATETTKLAAFVENLTDTNAEAHTRLSHMLDRNERVNLEVRSRVDRNLDVVTGRFNEQASTIAELEKRILVLEQRE